MISRRPFPSGRGLRAKALEMNLRFMGFVLMRRPNVVWVHDPQLVGLTLFLLVLWRPYGRHRRLVWDLHELPSERFLRTKLSIWGFRWALKHSDQLIIANRRRQDYLEEQFGFRPRNPWILLENLPTQEFVDRGKGKLFCELEEWLGGSEFVLSQGLGRNERCAIEAGKAVAEFPELKLVFLGPLEDNCVEELRSFPGDQFEDKIFVTGMVVQEQLYNVLDYSKVSMVFYRNSGPNQWLCAPNRLFQAVARGVPFIAGANPTFVDIVSHVGSGILLEGDGSSVEDIVGALRRFLEEEATLKEAANSSRNAYVSENQAEGLRKVFGD